MAKSRDFNRLDRVSATIKRALAEPVSEMARAARAGLVTITEVDVSPDMRHASVRLSVLGDEDAIAQFLGELRTDAWQLQAVLGRELRTKRTPVLKFIRDDAIERADRVTRLLADSPSSSGTGQ